LGQNRKKDSIKKGKKPAAGFEPATADRQTHAPYRQTKPTSLIDQGGGGDRETKRPNEEAKKTEPNEEDKKREPPKNVRKSGCQI